MLKLRSSLKNLASDVMFLSANHIDKAKRILLSKDIEHFLPLSLSKKQRQPSFMYTLYFGTKMLATRK